MTPPSHPHRSTKTSYLTPGIVASRQCDVLLCQRFFADFHVEKAQGKDICSDPPPPPPPPLPRHTPPPHSAALIHTTAQNITLATLPSGGSHRWPWPEAASSGAACPQPPVRPGQPPRVQQQGIERGEGRESGVTWIQGQKWNIATEYSDIYIQYLLEITLFYSIHIMEKKRMRKIKMLRETDIN